MQRGTHSARGSLRVGDWVVQPERLLVTREGRPDRRVSPRAMAVFEVLANANGDVVRKNDLLDAVWGKAEVSEGMLSQTILELRQAFDDDAKDPKVIETIRSVGFRLMKPVEAAGAAGADDQQHVQERQRRTWALAALVLVLAAAAWWSNRDAVDAPSDELPRIMVMPFEDHSPSQDYSYFAAGLADEIALHLARSAELRLVSDRAVGALAKTGAATGEIADRLDVDLILTGSVQRREDSIRLIARLTDADRNEELWVTSFDRPVGDVFAILDETSRSIAAIVIRDESLPELSRPTEDLSAYDLYLQGRANQRQLSTATIDESVRLFMLALEIDPNFSLARARLAESLAIQGYIFQAGADKLQSALREAEIALQEDASLADSMYAKALAMSGLGNFSAARDQIAAAVSLMPNHPDALFLSGSLAETRGDLVAAVRDYSLALRLDPTMPRTVALGRLYLQMGDAGRAAKIAERGHLLAPGYPTLYLAYFKLLTGEEGEALELCDQAIDLGLPRSKNLCGFVALVSGREADARRLLTEDWNDDPRIQTGPFTTSASATHLANLTTDPRNRGELLSASEQIVMSAIAAGNDHWALRYNLAAIAALRGERATSMEWLHEAFDEGFRDVMLLELDPAFMLLREIPDFEALVNKLETEVRTAALSLGIAP